MKTANLVTIRDELLRGDVLDTNSKWICERLTKSGIKVESIVIREDDAEKISQVLSKTLSSQVDCIVISGGLGTTPDDATNQAIALRKKLELNQKAFGWIEKKLSSLASSGMMR